MKSVAMSFDGSPEWEDEPTTVMPTLGDLVATAVMAVTEDAPIAEVQRLLASQRVPAVAVVDEPGVLRGVITRTDVLRSLGDPQMRCAGDIMSRFVLALPPRAAIEKAAALMAYEGVGHIAVLDSDGELLGLVSAVDVARHYAVSAGYRIAGR